MDHNSLVPQQVERIMQSVSQNVSSEIQRSLDFYSATSTDGGFSKIYISGGSAKIPSLYRTLEQNLKIPVEITNPFKNIEVDSSRFDLDYLREVAPMAAVSAGLALRKAGD